MSHTGTSKHNSSVDWLSPFETPPQNNMRLTNDGEKFLNCSKPRKFVNPFQQAIKPLLNSGKHSKHIICFTRPNTCY